MGFAARVNRDEANDATTGQSNLILLSPLESSPHSSQAVPEVVNIPAEVKALPKSPQLPLPFKLLVIAQQGSTAITGVLVAVALVIYSWTVYLDKTIYRSSQRLEGLKVSTQQVTTANETLKHSMAKEAESPAAGFKPFEPKRAIFLSPAPIHPETQLSIETHESQAPPMPHPLGY